MMKIFFVIILVCLCSGSYAQSREAPNPVQKMLDEEHKMTEYLQQVRNGQVGRNNDYALTHKYYIVKSKVSKEDFGDPRVRDSIRNTVSSHMPRAKEKNCDKIIIRIYTRALFGRKEDFEFDVETLIVPGK